jgi:hypothetical protein
VRRHGSRENYRRISASSRVAGTMAE